MKAFRFVYPLYRFKTLNEWKGNICSMYTKYCFISQEESSKYKKLNMYTWWSTACNKETQEAIRWSNSTKENIKLKTDHRQRTSPTFIPHRTTDSYEWRWHKLLLIVTIDITLFKCSDVCPICLVRFDVAFSKP